MQSDGRIRSKDIGTGEVNSRIVTDLYSEDYDGSKTDPEAQPGASGWILLKNGLAVFNQAIIRGTITAAEIIGAVIRGGEVNIREGGRLTVGGDSAAVPPVAPLVVIDETAVRVGPDVEMNTTGLFIDGGQAKAEDLVVQKTHQPGVTLTTTLSEKAFTTVTVPAWALKAQVQVFSNIQAGNGGTSPYGILTRSFVDGVDLGGAQQDVAVGATARSMHFDHIELLGGSLGSTIRVAVHGQRNGGSQNESASAVVMGSVLFTR